MINGWTQILVMCVQPLAIPVVSVSYQEMRYELNAHWKHIYKETVLTICSVNKRIAIP